MEERLKQQLDFILEIDKEKNILRQTHLSGHGRRENDAEHAWHMAIMAYLLKDYANEPVDIAKVMIMCLIHDIVEIDAGDTYAYDTERLKTQKAREDAAKERIFSLLPEDQKKELTLRYNTLAQKLNSGENFVNADALFHCYIAECAGNSVLQNLMPTITRAVSLSISESGDAFRARSSYEHLCILNAICRNDTLGARYAMITHLNVTRDYFAHQDYLSKIVWQNR